MFRRAIPMVAVLFGAPLLAAPVPPAPRADDALAPSAVRLLQHRKVQKELKMTAEQRLAILDGLADLGEEHDKKVEAVAQMQNTPDDAFDKLDKEHKKGVDKLLGDAAAKSLGAPQRKRLQQLDWQVRGVAAFADPVVEKTLRLTDAQKKKAAELVGRQKSVADDFLDGGGPIPGGGNGGGDDDAKRKTELFAKRKEFLKQMEDALTADQKAGWTTLLGTAPTGIAIDDLWLKIEEDAEPDEPK